MSSSDDLIPLKFAIARMVRNNKGINTECLETLKIKGYDVQDFIGSMKKLVKKFDDNIKEVIDFQEHFPEIFYTKENKNHLVQTFSEIHSDLFNVNGDVVLHRGIKIFEPVDYRGDTIYFLYIVGEIDLKAVHDFYEMKEIEGVCEIQTKPEKLKRRM